MQEIKVILPRIVAQLSQHTNFHESNIGNDNHHHHHGDGDGVVVVSLKWIHHVWYSNNSETVILLDILDSKNEVKKAIFARNKGDLATYCGVIEAAYKVS